MLMHSSGQMSAGLTNIDGITSPTYKFINHIRVEQSGYRVFNIQFIFTFEGRKCQFDFKILQYHSAKVCSLCFVKVKIQGMAT